MNPSQVRIDGIGIATVHPFGPARALALEAVRPLGEKLIAWTQELERRELDNAGLMQQLMTNSGVALMTAMADVDPERMPELIRTLLATTVVRVDATTRIELRDEETINRVFEDDQRAFYGVLGLALIMLVNDGVPSWHRSADASSN
jgi:hypothetical protein